MNKAMMTVRVVLNSVAVSIGLIGMLFSMTGATDSGTNALVFAAFLLLLDASPFVRGWK